LGGFARGLGVGAGTEKAFHFGTGQTFTSRISASLYAFPASDPTPFSTLPPPAPRSPQQAQQAQEEEEKNEDLKAAAFVKGQSGEEGETVLKDVPALLYWFDREGNKWAHRGAGPLHLNRGDGHYRIVMRRDQIETVALNTLVFAAMKPELVDSKSAHQVRFLAPLPGDNTKVVPMSLRFKTTEDAESFYSAWKQAIEDLQNGKTPTKEEGAEAE
jgi:hypothetical protein